MYQANQGTWRIEYLQGFDEYMNLVLDEAEEVSMKRQTRKAVGATHLSVARLAWAEVADSEAWLKLKLECSASALASHPAELLFDCDVDPVHSAGRILLKGENITLMQTTCASSHHSFACSLHPCVRCSDR